MPIRALRKEISTKIPFRSALSLSAAQGCDQNPGG
jgi:hypothetical protein